MDTASTQGRPETARPARRKATARATRPATTQRATTTRRPTRERTATRLAPSPTATRRAKEGRYASRQTSAYPAPERSRRREPVAFSAGGQRAVATKSLTTQANGRRTAKTSLAPPSVGRTKRYPRERRFPPDRPPTTLDLAVNLAATRKSPTETLLYNIKLL